MRRRARRKQGEKPDGQNGSSHHASPAGFASRDRRRRTTTTNAAPPTTSTTNATIAPIGTPPLSSVGFQYRSPVTDVGAPATASGTFQSKILVRFDLSLSCGGSAALLIQWMRWSCHAKRPVLSSVFHSGAAFASADFGCPVFFLVDRFIAGGGDRLLLLPPAFDVAAIAIAGEADERQDGERQLQAENHLTQDQQLIRAAFAGV